MNKYLKAIVDKWNSLDEESQFVIGLLAVLVLGMLIGARLG